MDHSTLANLAELICGEYPGAPIYRSGDKLTKFFFAADVSRFVHDGSTRRLWVTECLKSSTKQELAKILKRFVSPYEYGGDKTKVQEALKALNEIVYVEGFKMVLNGLEPSFKKIEVNFNLDSERDVPESMEMPDLQSLCFEPPLEDALKIRLDEIQKCIEVKAYLAATILMGSLIEGLLLGMMQKYPEEASKCKSAPVDSKSGKIKLFSNWTLSEMIDVAHKLGWIRTSISKFSHVLRDFRNLVHPNVQVTTNTYPDEESVKISWIVIQASLNDLSHIIER